MTVNWRRQTIVCGLPCRPKMLLQGKFGKAKGYPTVQAIVRNGEKTSRLLHHFGYGKLTSGTGMGRGAPIETIENKLGDARTYHENTRMGEWAK